MTTKPQSTTEETLEPCPFCGSKPETGITGAPECDNWRYVKCSNNYCSIRYSLFTVKSWNTRHSPASTAPVVDEDQQLVQRIRSLVESAFITGHMHGPSADYQVQLKFRTLKESQHCQTLIEALVHPEYRASFIKQGVLEPFTAAATAVEQSRSIHFPDEALNKGFPDHISRDGTAYYSDGTVLPSVAPMEQSDEYAEISCAGCGRDTDTKLLLCPTCVDSGHEGAR